MRPTASSPFASSCWWPPQLYTSTRLKLIRRSGRMLIVLKNCVKICQNPTHTLIRKSAASGPVRIVADSAAIKLAAEDETMYGFASAVSTDAQQHRRSHWHHVPYDWERALLSRCNGWQEGETDLAQNCRNCGWYGNDFRTPPSISFSHFRVGCRLNQKNAGPVPTSRTVAKTLRFVFLTFR